MNCLCRRLLGGRLFNAGPCALPFSIALGTVWPHFLDAKQLLSKRHGAVTADDMQGTQKAFIKNLKDQVCTFKHLKL